MHLINMKKISLKFKYTYEDDAMKCCFPVKVKENCHKILINEKIFLHLDCCCLSHIHY